MSEARVLFVPTPADAPPPEGMTTVIVLDTAWTPLPNGRPDMLPLRRLVSAVIERTDVVDAALRLVDDWGRAVGAVERLAVDGVSYWFRLREVLWLWLQERLIWHGVLAELVAGAGRRGTPMPAVVLDVPSGEPALADVARALTASAGVRVVVSGAPPKPNDPPAIRADEGAPAGRPDPWAGALRRMGRILKSPPSTDRGVRERTLEQRVRTIVSGKPRILVLSHSGIHQRTGAAGSQLVDPILGPVVDRLGSPGEAPIIIGLGLDHREDDHWASIASQPDMLPQSILRVRWSDPVTEKLEVARADDVALALSEDSRAAVPAGDIDLAAALMAEVQAFAKSGLRNALQHRVRAERMLAELKPVAMLLTHEGIRMPWLAAARGLGIPVFAVQHGMLYASHPGYQHDHHPLRLLPTRTFVSGVYERRILLDHGGYRPEEVEAVGSTRMPGEPEDRDTEGGSADRAAVRRELGIDDEHRMLVVSTAPTALARRFYLAEMLDRILGGPLPGVHIVFKQHPGEADEGPYRALLSGLAAAGGYQPPPMTVGRDMDLYRLLRAADAHLGLHSTVLTDAVVVGTPNLVAVTQAYSDILGYVGAGVARPVRDVADLLDALTNPRPIDPAARRAFLDDHFRTGDAAARIAHAITEAVDTEPVR
jgi:hypothetical protein